MGKVMEKQKILDELKQAIDSGIVDARDVQSALTSKTPSIEVAKASPLVDIPESKQKMSISSIFYHIAGVLLFGVLSSIIIQTPGTGNFLLHLTLTAVVGVLLWGIASVLARHQSVDSTTSGIESALLVTGSLSVLAGVFVAAFHFAPTNGFGNTLVLLAVFFLLASVMHFVADILLRRFFLVGVGVLTSVAAIALIAFRLLIEMRASFDIWAVVVIGLAGWLAIVTRLFARSLYVGRLHANSFDGLALWVALIVAYAASYGEYGAIWLIGLLIAVFGLFYASVVQRKRYFLGTAAAFMVLTLVTISFKYFSGFGITVNLSLSVITILGSAYVVSQVNQRYFK